MFLSWKLAHGQIKFRSNWGRYAGKRVSLMSLSLFNCLIIYWAKTSRGDSKSHHDGDTDGLYPVDRFQGRAPVTWPCHANGARAGGPDHRDGAAVSVVPMTQPLCSGVTLACHCPNREVTEKGKINLGGASSSCPDTTSFQPAVFPPPHFSFIQQSGFKQSVYVLHGAKGH